MTKIIGLIQAKGGSGRSTLATNIAGMISETKTVALIDCDMPQGSSTSWYAVRQEAGRAGKLSAGVAHNYDELIERVETLSDDHDYIVIDATPGGTEKINLAALILSDLCLVPVEPSAFDIWATVDLVEIIEQAKKAKPDLTVRLVWNQYKASTTEAAYLSKLVKAELGLKELAIKLGDRTAYKVAGRKGLTMRESGNKKAQAEITALGMEVQKLLKTKFLKDS